MSRSLELFFMKWGNELENYLMVSSHRCPWNFKEIVNTFPESHSQFRVALKMGIGRERERGGWREPPSTHRNLEPFQPAAAGAAAWLYHRKIVYVFGTILLWTRTLLIISKPSFWICSLTSQKENNRHTESYRIITRFY